jgi:hypothetical protein
LVGNDRECYIFYKNGEEGKAGGNAGHGGYGGIGGFGGMFLQNSIFLNRSINISFGRNISFGEIGNAGIPGLGGRDGDDAEKYSSYRRFFNCVGYCEEILVSITRGDNGKVMLIDYEQHRISKENEFNKRYTIYENQQRKKIFKIIYEMETSYLDFAIKNRSESSLGFLSGIIDQNQFDLTFEGIVERIKLFNNYKYHKLLPNLQNEIVNYCKSNEVDIKEKLALNYAHAVISSLILRYDDVKDSIFVINIEEFIQDKKREVEKWTKLNGQQVRYAYKENYQNNLKNRIEESDEIIENLKKEIEVEEDRMDDELKIVIKQIKEMKEQSLKNEKQILKFKEESEKQFKLKMFFLGAKSICKFIKFAGPKGAITGIALNGVFEIAETFMVHEPEKPEISENIKSLAKNFYANKNKFKNKIKRQEQTNEEEKIDEEEDKENDELASEISNVLVSLIKTFKDGGETDESDSLLKENSVYIVALGELEHKMTNLKGNILNDFNNTRVLIKNNENSGSINIFKKWELKRNLVEMKEKLDPLIKSLDSNEDINLIINRIDSLVDTYMEIYQQIDKYKYQFDLANFVEAMIIDNDSEMNRFRNDDKKAIYELKNMLHKNLMIEQYHLAIHAFHYWSYPLQCEYENKIKTRHVESEENIDLLRNKITNKLESIHQIVSSQKSTIDIGIDRYVMRSTFDKAKPFYKWTSKKHEEEIRKLFNGDIVTFFSDLREKKVSTEDKEAIKFNRVYITMEFISSLSKNQTLNNFLIECDIKLIHSGQSIFKYGNSINEVNSNLNGHQFVLIYDYKSLGRGDHKNEIYEKLISNEPLLSPYTYWGIQIKPHRNYVDFFKQMAGLYKSNKDEIIISLCGEAKYIRSDYPKKYNISSCEKLTHQSTTRGTYSDVLPTDSSVTSTYFTSNSNVATLSLYCLIISFSFFFI